MPPIPTLLTTFLTAALVPAAGPELRATTFRLTGEAEVVATLSATCAGCSWAAPGREAAVLRLTVDGRYSQDLMLSRGEGPDRYQVTLGALKPGDHRLSVSLDRSATPPGAQAASVLSIETRASTPGTSEYVALAHAPRLYARPDTIGRFSDLPLLMWYETEATPGRTWLRYSVIFSNEDGGTPADRLMATWGRVTDIEYVYGVELDQAGRILAAEYQGPEHKVLPFQGQRDGLHPRLWVVTQNNMVSDHGTTTECYAPAPVPFTLDEVSREVVMDAHPWTYRVSDEEALREGRIDETASPGSGRIPDPRRFVYLEACGELEGTTLAFDVAVETGTGTRWVASDGDNARARIARSGCFRGAVALPPPAGSEQRIAALRFRAYARPSPAGAPPQGATVPRITRVNRLFRLGPDHVPGPSLFHWEGDAILTPNGPPFELTLPAPAPSR